MTVRQSAQWPKETRKEGTFPGGGFHGPLGFLRDSELLLSPSAPAP